MIHYEADEEIFVIIHGLGSTDRPFIQGSHELIEEAVQKFGEIGDVYVKLLRWMSACMKHDARQRQNDNDMGQYRYVSDVPRHVWNENDIIWKEKLQLVKEYRLYTPYLEEPYDH